MVVVPDHTLVVLYCGCAVKQRGGAIPESGALDGDGSAAPAALYFPGTSEVKSNFLIIGCTVQARDICTVLSPPPPPPVLRIVRFSHNALTP